MADTKLSALTEVSTPDLSDFSYWLDDTGPTSYKIGARRLMGFLDRGRCEGRLTTETGVPVSTTDRTAQSTLYWTPIDAGRMTVYDGTRWLGYQQTELSLALSGLTSGKAYDAFLDYNSGTPALALGPAWTNATTRSTGLTTQDGILVLSGTTTKRYVGTIYTTGTTTTEDSGGFTGTTQVGAKRFVWNYYNRVRRPLAVRDLTDTWTYTTASFRQANGATGNKVEYVSGVADLVVEGMAMSVVSSGGTALANGIACGIGIDSTTVSLAKLVANFYAFTSTVTNQGLTAQYRGHPGLGYHALNWLEYGATNATYAGDYGTTDNSCQSGLVAMIEG